MAPSGLAQSTGEASGNPLNLALVGVLDFDRRGKESSAAAAGNSGGHRDGDGGGGGLYEASAQGFSSDEVNSCTTCVGVVLIASPALYFKPWSGTTPAQ